MLSESPSTTVLPHQQLDKDRFQILLYLLTTLKISMLPSIGKNTKKN